MEHQQISVLITAGGLFKESWRALKKEWRLFVGVAAVPAVVMFLLSFPPFLTAQSLGTSVPVFFGVVAVLGIFISLFFSLWGAIAMLYAIKERGSISVVESYKKSWEHLGSFIAVNVLAGLAIAGGTVLLLIPGVILAVSYRFVSYAFVFEGDRGMPTLFKSLQYVRGRWWGVAWRLLALGLVYIGLSAIYGIVATIVSSITSVSPMFIENLFSPVLSLLFIPFSALYYYFLYTSLQSTRSELVHKKVEGNRMLVAALAGVAVLTLGITVIRFSPWLGY